MTSEDIPQTKSAIRNAEANWDRKWTELLKNSVLASVMSADPVSTLTPDGAEPQLLSIAGNSTLYISLKYYE